MVGEEGSGFIYQMIQFQQERIFAIAGKILEIIAGFNWVADKLTNISISKLILLMKFGRTKVNCYSSLKAQMQRRAAHNKLAALPV